MIESQSFIILGLTLEVFHYFIHSLWEKRMIILWSIQILCALKARQVLCISLKSLVARFSYPQFPHTLSKLNISAAEVKAMTKVLIFMFFGLVLLSFWLLFFPCSDCPIKFNEFSFLGKKNNLKNYQIKTYDQEKAHSFACSLVSAEALLTRIWSTVLIAVRGHSVRLISVAWCMVIPTIKKTNDKALFHLFIYKKTIYFSKSCIIFLKSEAKPDEFGLNDVEYLWPLSENRKCN